MKTETNENKKEILELLIEDPGLLDIDTLKYLLKPIEPIEPNEIWKIVRQNKKPEIIKYFINQHEFKRRKNWKEFESILDLYNIKYLYHITHKDNLENIEKYGGLFSWKMCEELEIPVKEFGGNKLSRKLDRDNKLEYYVRLGFNYNLPMFKYRIEQGNMVVLEIKREVIYTVKTLFSDTNANSNNAWVGDSISYFKRIDLDIAKEGWYYIGNRDYRWYAIQSEVLTAPFLQGKMINKVLNYVRK